MEELSSSNKAFNYLVDLVSEQGGSVECIGDEIKNEMNRAYCNYKKKIGYDKKAEELGLGTREYELISLD